MKRANLAPEGGLWAVRCECLPISDEQHFENVIGYIHDHDRFGAVVWDARDEAQV